MSQWREPHGTWIVGHRGAPRRARENTIESLDVAETFRVDAVEFDVRQTRDGEAVLYHDEDVVLGTPADPRPQLHLARSWRSSRSRPSSASTGSPGSRRSFTVTGETPLRRRGQRRRGHAGRHDGATRREARERVRRRRPVPRRVVRRRVPEAHARGRARDRDELSLRPPVALPSPAQSTPLFPPVDAIGPKRDLVSPALLAQAAAADLTVHPWTVDDADEIRRLILAGVASVTTNAPDEALLVRGGADAHDTGLALSGRQPA